MRTKVSLDFIQTSAIEKFCQNLYRWKQVPMDCTGCDSCQPTGASHSISLNGQLPISDISQSMWSFANWYSFSKRIFCSVGGIVRVTFIIVFGDKILFSKLWFISLFPLSFGDDLTKGVDSFWRNYIWMKIISVTRLVLSLNLCAFNQVIKHRTKWYHFLSWW
jgi:hypothetical protein